MPHTTPTKSGQLAKSTSTKNLTNLHYNVEGMFASKPEDLERLGCYEAEGDNKRSKALSKTKKESWTDNSADSLHQDVSASTPLHRPVVEVKTTEVLAVDEEPPSFEVPDSTPSSLQNRAKICQAVAVPVGPPMGNADPMSDTDSVFTIPDNMHDLCRRKRQRDLQALQDEHVQKKQRLVGQLQYTNERERLGLVNQNLTIKLSRQDTELHHFKVQLATQQQKLDRVMDEKSTEVASLRASLGALQDEKDALGSQLAARRMKKLVSLTYQEKIARRLEACLASFETIPFDQWNNAKPSPDRMANAGFFLRDKAFRKTGDGGGNILDDTTTCIECGVEVVDWKEEDDPLQAHVDACEEAGRACALVDSLIADRLSKDENEHGAPKIKVKPRGAVRGEPRRSRGRGDRPGRSQTQQ